MIVLCDRLFKPQYYRIKLYNVSAFQDICIDATLRMNSEYWPKFLSVGRICSVLWGTKCIIYILITRNTLHLRNSLPRLQPNSERRTENTTTCPYPPPPLNFLHLSLSLSLYIYIYLNLGAEFDIMINLFLCYLRANIHICMLYLTRWEVKLDVLIVTVEHNYICH